MIEELESTLERRIASAGVGEFDGDEFGEGTCRLFMYGPDADRLYEVIESILKAAPAARGGFAIKRYGGAGDFNASEVRIDL
jgi:hypothetical protein